MGELIPPMKGSNEKKEVIDKFQQMVNTGEIKSFVIVGLDNEGHTIVAQHVDTIIEAFGLLKAGEITISSLSSDYEDDCDCE
mgnify:CR=1 FL=1